MNRNSAESEKPVYCIRESSYHGSLPFFYSDKDFPELEVIKSNWKIIWEEVKNYEARHGMVSGMNTYSPPEVKGTNPWSNMYLENFMWKFHSNRRHFPKTCLLLSQIPACTLAAISILSPRSAIEPHYGDTNAVIRCHVGLQIPSPYPDCGIRVGSEAGGWKDGELTMFTEAHLHTTWNHTDSRRYVLVFDIVHPRWANKKYWISSSVLGAQSFIFLEKRIPLLKKIPTRFLPAVHLPLSMLWRVYLPFQRSAGFLSRIKSYFSRPGK